MRTVVAQDLQFNVSQLRKTMRETSENLNAELASVSDKEVLVYAAAVAAGSSLFWKSSWRGTRESRWTIATERVRTPHVCELQHHPIFDSRSPYVLR